MLGALRASSAVGNTAPIINTSQSITAASTIAITASVANQICPVTSTAAITLTSNPQLASGTFPGQRVTIQNAGSFTITFTDGNGLSLQGTLAIGSTQFATFVNLGGFWQLEDTNGSPAWNAFSFLNGYVNWSGSQPCEFTRFRNEIILRGHANRATAYTSATAVIAILPVGHRPAIFMRFPLDTIAHANISLQIQPSGDLLLLLPENTPNIIAPLNAVRFRV